MLYSEFLAGTKAPETRETYQQFKVIEQIYMDCETMSKLSMTEFASWKPLRTSVILMSTKNRNRLHFTNLISLKICSRTTTTSIRTSGLQMWKRRRHTRSIYKKPSISLRRRLGL